MACRAAIKAGEELSVRQMEILLPPPLPLLPRRLNLWNFAYVYNCLADRAWYSGVALMAACTIPALMRFGRGAWIQYRARSARQLYT